MLAWIADPNAWLALLTLTALEIVLGIDNIVVLSILVGRLPPEKRQTARLLGLALAMGTRLLLLFSLVWITHLIQPLFTVFGRPVSGRDLVLIIGGLFLIAKSTSEIHQMMEGEHEESHPDYVPKKVSVIGIIIQIALVDIVFSLDSVITAVGLANQISIMAIAIVIAVLVMMFAAKTIGEIVDEHPTIKMLALSFLILIGVALLGEGMSFHIPKGYLYFAMAYSVIVEMLNLKLRKKRKHPPSRPNPFNTP